MALSMGLLGAAVPEIPGAEFLLQEVVLSSSAPTVTFSNLDTYASEYKHLQIRLLARTTYNTSGTSRLQMRVNGDTTPSNYWRHQLNGGTNTYGSSGAQPVYNAVVLNDRLPAASNVFLPLIMDIPDAFANKRFLSRQFGGVYQDSSNMSVQLQSVGHSSTSLNSLTFGSGNTDMGTEGQFAIGSRFSLYGIKG